MTIPAAHHEDGASDRNDKRATKVADQLIRDIVLQGWPVGAVLGSEAELLERYDVSRAVFRESVRLLEHLGAATTRRGPGGGLVVTEPSTAASVQAFIVYLTGIDLSLGDLFEARISLERAVVALAADRADDEQIAVLRERVEMDRCTALIDAASHHALHTMIGATANNPAAELFVDVLGRITAQWSYPELPPEQGVAAREASTAAHAALVDAITAGDAGLAERRMSRHLSALGDWLGRHRQSPRSMEWVLDEAGGEEKLGSRVARTIIVDIVDQGWPIGEVLASETDMIERYGVSRSVLRESIRLLEYLEVAVMKRGPGGGLVVTRPGIRPIVRASTVFLEQRRISPGDLIALRRVLESDAVGSAAERATPGEVDALRCSLVIEADAGFEEPLEQGVHAHIAELSGNPALALLVRVLLWLTRIHAELPERNSAHRSALNAEIQHAHDAIVEAVAQGDPALARRRMTRHLIAMQPLLR